MRDDGNTTMPNSCHYSSYLYKPCDVLFFAVTTPEQVVVDTQVSGQEYEHLRHTQPQEPQTQTVPPQGPPRPHLNAVGKRPRASLPLEPAYTSDDAVYEEVPDYLRTDSTVAAEEYDDVIVPDEYDDTVIINKYVEPDPNYHDYLEMK